MTLKLDDPSFTLLQQWRQQYFPPKLNFIPAHLTLLHKVSEEQLARLKISWHLLGHLAPLRLSYTAPRLLGNGVAIDVQSSELLAVHVRLVELIAGSLSRQDRQPFRPHVTIQNKVGAIEARSSYEWIRARFAPWNGEGKAVLAWQYLGGPWRPRGEYAFNGGA